MALRFTKLPRARLYLPPATVYGSIGVSDIWYLCVVCVWSYIDLSHTQEL